MAETRAPIAGIIFDLDGTLVDSGLEFGLIRREMGLPHGVPVLESVQALPEDQAFRCREILRKHERDAAERAVPIPGILPFLDEMERLGLRRAVFTRNSRWATTLTLKRCGLVFDVVLTRDDGPVKPDPWAIHRICEIWSIPPERVAVIGDFSYDIQAGRRAGARAVLFTRGRPLGEIPEAHLAELYLDDFQRARKLLGALGW